MIRDTSERVDINIARDRWVRGNDRVDCKGDYCPFWCLEWVCAYHQCCSWPPGFTCWWRSGIILPRLSTDWYQCNPWDQTESGWQVRRTLLFPTLTINMLCYRLLYQPQLVVDGNVKLVHQIQKWPEDDVSLSNGELFMVKRVPYAGHGSVN